MKESKAIKQWCPVYQVSVSDTGFAREDNRAGDCNCLGSKCMAWISEPVREPSESIDRPGDSWCENDPADVYFPRVRWYRDVPGGYCGLARRG